MCNYCILQNINSRLKWKQKQNKTLNCETRLPQQIFKNWFLSWRKAQCYLFSLTAFCVADIMHLSVQRDEGETAIQGRKVLSWPEHFFCSISLEPKQGKGGT